jgi:magnesium transporter
MGMNGKRPGAVRYLSQDEVIGINRQLCTKFGLPCGLLASEALTEAVQKPALCIDGYEPFPELWEKAAVLMLFLPLILSSGGNSGSQATTLIIRAMAIKDVALKDWWLVFVRELSAGLLLGCALAALGLLRIFLWQTFHLADYGQHYALLAFAIGGSLVGVVLWGSLVGAMLPMLLRWLRLDPATCSAPFVATMVYVTGIIIYFNVAYVALRGTLL